jgi:alpha-ketoglutarate-dependent taurine dioxygenase
MFPNTQVAVPLHTDGHITEWPMQYILMLCVRTALHGGECIIQDGWNLIEDIAASDPCLYRDLFTDERRIELLGGRRHYDTKTVSARCGSIILIHPPYHAPEDYIGRAFQERVDRGAVVEFTPQQGDIFILNNWRMLHGRRAFTDLNRQFIRLWPHGLAPCPAPRAFTEQARLSGGKPTATAADRGEFT